MENKFEISDLKDILPRNNETTKIFNTISKNENHLKERLKKLDLKNEKLIFVVGAGISMSYGLKSWNGLANSLMEELHIKEKMKSEELIILQKHDEKKKITLAKNRLGEMYYEKLREETKKNPKYPINLGPLEVLKEINTSHENIRFITTNIDTLLEVALELDIENIVVGINGEDKKLYKIHGCIDGKKNSKENKMVFTPMEYINFYGKEENVRNIKSIVQRSVVIFIGKELENELLEILLSSNNKNPQIYLLKPYEGTISYELLPTLNLDISYFEHYEKNGVLVLPYHKYEFISDYLRKMVFKSLNQYSINTSNKIETLEFQDLDFTDSKLLGLIEKRIKILDLKNLTTVEKQKLQILLKNKREILNYSKSNSNIYITLFDILEDKIGGESSWEMLL
ncbi:MAG: SIR2 family protein [Fusobacteriaceae bacterium]